MERKLSGENQANSISGIQSPSEVEVAPVEQPAKSPESNGEIGKSSAGDVAKEEQIPKPDGRTGFAPELMPDAAANENQFVLNI